MQILAHDAEFIAFFAYERIGSITFHSKLVVRA